jgi:hypothetical protein
MFPIRGASKQAGPYLAYLPTQIRPFSLLFTSSSQHPI